MKFHIAVTVDSNDKKIKDECLDVLARFLTWRTKGAHYGVSYNPNEIDTDKLGKAQIMKKKLLFPIFLMWIFVAWLLFKIGDWQRNLGNRMSGYRFDDSIGSVHVN